MHIRQSRRQILAQAVEGGAAKEADVLMLVRTGGRNRTKKEYDDLLAEIYRFFAGRLEQAGKAGIDPVRIVIDPGIGFGKPAAGNFEIISRLSEFAPLGRPILVGPSRKSFLSLAGLASPEDRLEGTLAACTVAVQAGAHVLRVHDVGPVKKIIATAARFAGIRTGTGSA
jgi:dihydropteroate synthase